MNARTFHFTVDHMVGRRELELDVTYTMTPPIAATYWQPAEGAECEIVSVEHNGKPFTLSEAEEDALFEQVMERARADWAEDTAAEADWRYEQHRDQLLQEQWERGA